MTTQHSDRTAVPSAACGHDDAEEPLPPSTVGGAAASSSPPSASPQDEVAPVALAGRMPVPVVKARVRESATSPPTRLIALPPPLMTQGEEEEQPRARLIEQAESEELPSPDTAPLREGGEGEDVSVVGGTPEKAGSTTAAASPPEDVRTWSPQTPPLEKATALPLILKTRGDIGKGVATPPTIAVGGRRKSEETDGAEEELNLKGPDGDSHRTASRALAFLPEDGERPSEEGGGSGDGDGEPQRGKEKQWEVDDDDEEEEETVDEGPAEELERIKKHIILIRPPTGTASPLGKGPVTPTSSRTTSAGTTKHVDPAGASAAGERKSSRSSFAGAARFPAESASAVSTGESRKSSTSTGSGSSHHRSSRASRKGSLYTESASSHGRGDALTADEQHAKTPWEVTRVFHAVVAYSGYRALCQLLRVNTKFHAMATSDTIWKQLMTESLNLQPLVASLRVTQQYYRFFIDEILTTRALQGHYTFVSAAAQQQGNAVGGGSRTLSPLASGSLHNGWDIYNFDAVTLLITSATFGQTNHPVGRVQLLIRYKNETMEVLQGSCRFSSYRRCYSFCTSAFSCPVRGPIFTVAVAQVHKPWPGESPQHFLSHKGGIRLVMTPSILEGKNPGSQVTETDVIAVSKPPSVVSTTTSILQSSRRSK